MPVFSDDRRRTARRVAAAAVMTALLAIAFWPTSRFVGTNFVVSRETVPLWKKASEFVARDARLREVSAAVLDGVAGGEARAAAAMAWTRAHIRHAPEDLPVIDDHISSVIERGYGQSDQQADVFTTLLTYGGVPAFWRAIGVSPRVIPLSYVLIDGHWRVFDVTRGLTFRTAAGALATPDDVAGDAALVERTARESGVDHLSAYLALFKGYRAPHPPDVLRAELQMPWRRVSFEVHRLMGMPPPTSRRPRGEEQQP